MGKCEACEKPTEYKSNVYCDKCFDKGIKEGTIELGENPPKETEDIPDEDIILDVDTALDQKEKRVIPSANSFLPPEIEKKFGEETVEIYKYFADVREKYPAVDVLGFNTFYKFVKDYISKQSDYLEKLEDLDGHIKAHIERTDQTLKEFKNQPTKTSGAKPDKDKIITDENS